MPAFSDHLPDPNFPRSNQARLFSPLDPNNSENSDWQVSSIACQTALTLPLLVVPPDPVGSTLGFLGFLLEVSSEVTKNLVEGDEGETAGTILSFSSISPGLLKLFLKAKEFQHLKKEAKFVLNKDHWKSVAFSEFKKKIATAIVLAAVGISGGVFALNNFCPPMITGSTGQSAFFTKDVDSFDDLLQSDLNLQLVAIEKPVPGIPALPPDHVADPLSPECSAKMEIDLEGLHDVDNRNFFGLPFSQIVVYFIYTGNPP